VKRLRLRLKFVADSWFALSAGDQKEALAVAIHAPDAIRQTTWIGARHGPPSSGAMPRTHPMVEHGLCFEAVVAAAGAANLLAGLVPPTIGARFSRPLGC